ncbi:MAG: hypothetical protein V3V13_01135 [Paracoccaceae bacterium]
MAFKIGIVDMPNVGKVNSKVSNADLGDLEIESFVAGDPDCGGATILLAKMSGK